MNRGRRCEKADREADEHPEQAERRTILPDALQNPGERDDAGSRQATAQQRGCAHQPDSEDQAQSADEDEQRLFQHRHRPREEAGKKQQDGEAEERRHATERGPDQAVQQQDRQHVEEHAEKMEPVGRRSDQHLNQGEEIQIARPAVGLERVLEIQGVDRNTERHVAQPQRPLEEILLVPEKGPERHLRVIGHHKQAGHHQDAQRDRGDHHQGHPAPLAGSRPRVPKRTTGTMPIANQTVIGDSAYTATIAATASVHRKGVPITRAPPSARDRRRAPPTRCDTARRDAAPRRTDAAASSDRTAPRRARRPRAAGSCRSTSSPSAPELTMSRVPGDAVATIGTPHAIASTSTLPNPS